MWPASDDEADVGATKLFDALWNGMYVEPMLLGRYPVDLVPLMEDAASLDGDLATIRQPLDFYGINYYNPLASRPPARTPEMPFEFRELLGYATTERGWPIVPDALREYLITLRARYRAALPPIMITESGCAYGMGRTRTASSTTSRASTTSTRTCARSRPPSSVGSTSGATTRGRCWTTSSGPRASPSGTAWCTSTSRPCGARRSAPSSGTPT